MKENLLRAKRLLERKWFASDDESEYQVEPYLEVVKSIDNEGAFNHIQDISTYQEFVITFDEFKAMLEAGGLTIGYSTFEDILEDYRNYKPTVCKISEDKNKIKILTKE